MNLFFVSLGCDKNLVDSEKMIALLSFAEYFGDKYTGGCRNHYCEYLWLYS